MGGTHTFGTIHQAAWTCKLPFAHGLAQARESYHWPNVSRICSSDLVLVTAHAFANLYQGDCTVYCQEGAGKAVRVIDDPSFYQLWISVRLSETENSAGRCPGDGAGSRADAVPC